VHATVTSEQRLGADLYALVVFLHKNCNADLFEAVGELDVTLTQIKALHYLEETDRELTVKEIAELIPISLAAASRTVDDLVRRGFVARKEDTIDRRMKRVRITDAGRAVTLRLNAARLNRLEHFVAALETPERAALSDALAALLAREEIAACRPTTDHAR
jgi:DNA-binding MarR family transcriptional regulator